MFSGGALVTGGWWPAFIFPEAAGGVVGACPSMAGFPPEEDPQDVQSSREREICVVWPMVGKGLPAGGSAEEAMK